MEQATKDKLVTNVVVSYKMASVQASAAVGGLGSIFLAMPEQMRNDLLSHIPAPAWALPIIGFVVIYVFRMWPQWNLTPNEAGAKSMGTDTTAESPFDSKPIDPK